MRTQDPLDIAQREVLKLSEALLRQQQELAAARAERDRLLAQLAQQRMERQGLLEEMRAARERAEASAATAVSADADATADALARALATLLSRRYWETQQGGGGLRGRLVRRWPRLGVLLGVRGRGIDAREREQVRMLEASALFDAAWYLRHNPDVAQAGVSPALHYLRAGAREGRDPGPAFRTRAYLAEHPELEGGAINPLVHRLSSPSAPAGTGG